MKKFILSIMIVAMSVSLVYGKSTLRPYYVNDAQDLTFWLRSEFLYKGEPKGQDHWQKPYETVQKHSGDCEDFAFLVQNIMNDLLTRAYAVSIRYPNRKIGHAICIFKDKKGWSYFTNQYYKKVNAKSIDDLVDKEFPNTTYDFIYIGGRPSIGDL